MTIFLRAIAMLLLCSCLVQGASAQIKIIGPGFIPDDSGINLDDPNSQNPTPVKQAQPKLPAFKDCEDCPLMVLIPGGTFVMGSTTFLEESPPHAVNVRSFLLGSLELTQGQWRSIMGSNPSFFSQCGDDCPVEKVSWDDAQQFIRKLNEKTKQKYRLPSEAEWEYAARAGSYGEYFFGDDTEFLEDYGWSDGNSKGRTQPGGQKLPNAFGLFDLYGNVWEWTEDCYHLNYRGAPTDGSAWTNSCNGNYRVLRGGAWNNHFYTAMRSANRFKLAPSFEDVGLNGFRLARSLTPEESAKAESMRKLDPYIAGQILKDCNDCPEVVYLKGKVFDMGSTFAPNEGPVRNVKIKDFFIGKMEITQGQWRSIMGSNPSRFNQYGDRLPVESVSWDDAQLFAKRLSQKTGKNYRLPSEAEWEFAARAGSTRRWSFGDLELSLGEFAWFGSNSNGMTQAVGQKKPNGFGLYDMYGNVEEWVTDCYHDGYQDAPSNGAPWLNECKGEYRVRRGGSWAFDANQLRSSYRTFGAPGLTRNYLGLRIVRDP